MERGVPTSPPPLDAYQNPLLRRRTSISQAVVVPASLNLHQQSSSYTSSGNPSSSSSSSSSSSTSTSSVSSGEFDLISVKPVYISLRDLLPSTAVNSPKPKSPAQSQVQSGPEISIKNHLVKQAAWAYLQPMSTSPDSSGRNFLRRLWDQFTSENPLAALCRFFNCRVFGRIGRAFDWLLRAIWVRSPR